MQIEKSFGTNCSKILKNFGSAHRYWPLNGSWNIFKLSEHIFLNSSFQDLSKMYSYITVANSFESFWGTQTLHLEVQSASGTKPRPFYLRKIFFRNLRKIFIENIRYLQRFKSFKGFRVSRTNPHPHPLPPLPPQKNFFLLFKNFKKVLYGKI